jgi:outer membrane protein assembly factor BamB
VCTPALRQQLPNTTEDGVALVERSARRPAGPVGEVVIVMCRDGQMLGLDSRTGGIRWQRATSIPFDSAPTLADGVIFAGGADRMLYAVAPPALS